MNRPGDGSSSRLPRVTIRVTGVPCSQAGDVLEVAVLPLTATSYNATLELTIRADGGLHVIRRGTLNLVLLERLRQLGLHDVEVEEG